MTLPKYAFVLFSDKTRKTITMDQAIAIQQVLDGTVEPLNDAQEAFAMKVEKIYFGAETRAQIGLQSVTVTQEIVEPESKLTNVGVLQGMNEQIPRGDR